MSRRAGAAAVTAAVTAALGLVAAAPGCGPARSGARLPPGARVMARGSLAYAVAIDAGGGLVTIELEERFALVVRDPDSGAERLRVDLGPPERDLPALAVGGGRAWVGGDDGWVRSFALDGGAPGPRWPVGAPVRALAWHPGGWLAIGDASGALCLRRTGDGALVQCLDLAAGPVEQLRRRGPGLEVEAGTTRVAVAVPSLAVSPAGGGGLAWGGGRVTVAGRVVELDGRPLVRLAERVRGVAVGQRGELVIAAWVAGLDDPSLVVVPHPVRAD